MRVRAIDSDNDWTFGNGRSNYKIKSDAVQQNVFTRLRSFTNDWHLDVDAGIDWIELLGRKGTQARIKSDIRRVVLGTFGVASIESLSVTTDRATRHASVNITITDIFSNTFTNKIEVG